MPNLFLIYILILDITEDVVVSFALVCRTIKSTTIMYITKTGERCPFFHLGCVHDKIYFIHRG